MPVAYLDVPAGADLDTKRDLVKDLYAALHEVYPFPDDTRIFLREWPLGSMSQNGNLGSEPARPVFIMHVPRGGDPDAKRKMLKKVSEAVTNAYQLPAFITFMHEHSLDVVAVEGNLLADDQRRVEDQRNAYPAAGE
ncbi:4-oxalocrotonate tautomerase family protein [Pendulispora albinea]|uniref:4-oxalocrotonate tautomerase family protein n=1 Tax=Pendulispora albinea TaxID=2741071 RepID=A0ABZ2LWR3_9BACT